MALWNDRRKHLKAVPTTVPQPSTDMRRMVEVDDMDLPQEGRLELRVMKECLRALSKLPDDESRAHVLTFLHRHCNCEIVGKPDDTA